MLVQTVQTSACFTDKCAKAFRIFMVEILSPVQGSTDDETADCALWQVCDWWQKVASARYVPGSCHTQPS